MTSAQRQPIRPCANLQCDGHSQFSTRVVNTHRPLDRINAFALLDCYEESCALWLRFLLCIALASGPPEPLYLTRFLVCNLCRNSDYSGTAKNMPQWPSGQGSRLQRRCPGQVAEEHTHLITGWPPGCAGLSRRNYASC